MYEEADDGLWLFDTLLLLDICVLGLTDVDLQAVTVKLFEPVEVVVWLGLTVCVGWEDEVSVVDIDGLWLFDTLLLADLCILGVSETDGLIVDEILLEPVMLADGEIVTESLIMAVAVIVWSWLLDCVAAGVGVWLDIVDGLVLLDG